jgi:hypothetical protein
MGETKYSERRLGMQVTGLGNVRGLGPRTKIFDNGGIVRARDLNDQYLSLVVDMLLKGTRLEPTIGDNSKLRARLRRLNPHLAA